MLHFFGPELQLCVGLGAERCASAPVAQESRLNPAHNLWVGPDSAWITHAWITHAWITHGIVTDGNGRA